MLGIMTFVAFRLVVQLDDTTKATIILSERVAVVATILDIVVKRVDKLETK